MARSVYGQLNQANIGANMDKLLREIFEGDPEKYATEASTSLKNLIKFLMIIGKEMICMGQYMRQKK
jgi:hypothetical protein